MDKLISKRVLGHYNKIHSFPFHQEVWGMRAGGSLFFILLCTAALVTLTTHAEATFW